MTLLHENLFSQLKDQGVVDVALLSLLQVLVKHYLGESACLQEAKGWQSCKRSPE
ncbi:hypothetical protein [Photobacterium profundum]|uniref:hypothetical protein n=1 Tax=Photobacterium profundum TaxID=74109 RepID=UPI0003117504|nr:hypothetical protein [Photobacterium profundum]